MTAPHEPHDPTAAELGSTGQFKAFVQQNDAPDEARERAAADPDASRPAPAAPPARAAADDDREIRFHDPVNAGPPVQSLRPDVELPPAELGSTAQFKAFASGEESTATPTTDGGHPRTDTERSRADAGPAGNDTATASPQPLARTGEANLDAPALPPADPSGKRNLLMALAAVVLVALVVVLLFLIV